MSCGRAAVGFLDRHRKAHEARPGSGVVLRVAECSTGRSEVTMYLMGLRSAIIIWTTLAVWPIEIVFDGIEAELTRRGVSL
jgi:hypothetical protein